MTTPDDLRAALREACDIAMRAIEANENLPSTNSEAIARLRSLADTEPRPLRVAEALMLPEVRSDRWTDEIGRVSDLWDTCDHRKLAEGLPPRAGALCRAAIKWREWARELERTAPTDADEELIAAVDEFLGIPSERTTP